MEIKRVKDDVNGNPRFVVHFLAFNTAEEIESSFLTWAGQKYQLAAMRAKCIGARPYKGKDFAGGFVFQAYSGTVANDVKKSFSNFENTTDATKGYRDIYLTVKNDADFYKPAYAAMQKVFAKDGARVDPKAAFAEILHQCGLCAESLRKRFGTRMTQNAIWYGACLVAMDFEESAKSDLGQ